MTTAKPLNFQESLAFKDIADNEFETLHPPQQMGNPARIAYGGYALAVAAKAACRSVLENYHLYSMMGNYLGPAMIDRPLRASVKTVRQTRTFATRLVEVGQKQDSGEFRPCLIALADFQTAEVDSLLEYSESPLRKYTHHSELPNEEKRGQALYDTGKVSKQLFDQVNKSFGVSAAYYETRFAPEGIFAQNLNGIAKNLPTTQDGLPITQKSSADWFQCRETLPTQTDHIASLAFYSDGALSFSPLSFSHKWFDDISACSSLDFALRIFSNEVDVNKWQLREIRTHVGSVGRTYSESWIWGEEGNAVACMTQQSIMRPNKATKKKGKL